MEVEEQSLTAFEKGPEFFEALGPFLETDLQYEPTLEESQKETILLNKLVMILQEYHEQSYLLDPFLEKMVTPVVEVLKKHVADYTLAGDKAQYSLVRVNRLTTLLYTFIKCRGRKTMVNFFPHQVPDLPIALDYLTNPKGPCQSPARWSLRYIILLWLSLICMIPFDLARFDVDVVAGSSEQPNTAKRIEKIALENLSRAGVEREAAAILLSRLYVREDTSFLLGGFIEDSIKWLGEEPNFFKTIGILQSLSEITKSGVPNLVIPYVPAIREILGKVDAAEFLLNNSLVRKYRIKLEGRVSTGSLPTATSKSLRKARALRIDSHTGYEDPQSQEINEDIDIPDELETAITVLLEGIQDRDTSVRYSAAKHLAHITERLPPFLREQIVQNVLELFLVHMPANQKMEDLPSIAEPTWQGTCLACAELARRGLIGEGHLEELLEWLKKALLFDIRQGSHSVGSSVRDAAAYVVWALARSQKAHDLKPFAIKLAQRLVAVSLFDREIQIRRAASAAFQENVGRLGLFPHGIDIIREADFFAVGIRKNSFLVAAPQVAKHPEYRVALLDHLMERTLIHWDPVMRTLGSQSLRAICGLDLEGLAPKVEAQLLILVKSFDANEVHGALLGLSELSASYKQSGAKEAQRLNLFKSTLPIFPSLLQKRSNVLPLVASCQFIANSISLDATEGSVSIASTAWRKVIDEGLRNRNTEVQEAAAGAWKAEFPKANPLLQQSIGYAFGLLAYDKYEHGVVEVLTCLLAAVDPKSPTYTSSVEARRNIYISLPSILVSLSNTPNPIFASFPSQILPALLRGLQDYTVDERGDVGSWARMACIGGLEKLVRLAFESEGGTGWMTKEVFDEIMRGMLKQGVERLDNVRRCAGEEVMSVLRLCEKAGGKGVWRVDGFELLEKLFLREEEEIGWHDGQWLFPRAVQLLEIPTYRKCILNGLVLSIGSKTDGTQRPVAKYLTSYASSLPLSSSHHTQVHQETSEPLTLLLLTSMILSFALQSPTQNQIVIPVLQTLDTFLEGGVLDRLGGDEGGRKLLKQMLDMVTRNARKVKNVQRIIWSMRTVNNFLGISAMAVEAASQVHHFLLHVFPKVRTETAEHLYIVMQSKELGFETEGAEEILLETDWNEDVKTLEGKVGDLVRILKEGVSGGV